MTTNTKKTFFINKKFFFYTLQASAANIAKSAELIKLFGGQIEQFLDHEVSYVLTDIPKSEWPPYGQDSMLEKARNYGVKLMSLQDLLMWCSKYVSSQSSSDDDDETANVKELKQPFIKFEDINCQFAPSVKEFAHWPEVNYNGNQPVGKSIFNDSTLLCTPNQSVNNIIHPNNSAQLTPQANSLRSSIPQSLFQQQQHRGARKRHSIYCEICNHKVCDRVEDHIQTQGHIINTDRTNWNDVHSVVESLPSLNTLILRRLTNLTPPKGEFLCLHKVDSVSQLFYS